MRESSSEHKEAPVNLAVMSAEPDVVGDESNPVHHHHHHHHDRHPLRRPDGAGSKTASHSSNGPGINPDDHEEEQPHSGSLHDSLKASADDTNDKSAFRITEVSQFTAADELEQSKGMSHEADSFMEEAKQRGQSESSESDETRASLLVNAGVPLSVKEQESDVANERVVPLDGAPNGPVLAQQPVQRRFRKVNRYERGRWMVEDTLEHRETEERPESEMRGAMGVQGGQGVVGRESPFSQRRKGGGEGEDQLHSRSSSDVGGQGVDPAEKGDQYQTDRTGLVIGGGGGGGGGGGEILSRNTSMSSLTTAGDKSVDGDHSGDQTRNESESEIGYPHPQASAGYSTPATTVSSPPQHPRHTVASIPSSTSSSSVALQHMSTIPNTTGEEIQPDQESKTGVHRVEKALSHLNKELQRLVEENKEITQLKDQNRTLEEQNQKLELDKQRLEDDNAILRNRLEELTQQNNRLQNENKRLSDERQQLALRGGQLVTELQGLKTGQSSNHS